MKLIVATAALAAASFVASTSLAQTMQPIPNPPEGEHGAATHHVHHHHHVMHHHKAAPAHKGDAGAQPGSNAPAENPPHQ